MDSIVLFPSIEFQTTKKTTSSPPPPCGCRVTATGKWNDSRGRKASVSS
ncbi:hypothetical protein MUK42_35032 [Musa troglodytarum]|uniref:Uncharacterized protein n=1 Tax=Musa troglodytarum TaxID=320322 RepID=A0A9E7H5Q9_9LILI|nr:hypothetical protein MUK42_35032 [Musa troglodytarum]